MPNFSVLSLRLSLVLTFLSHHFLCLLQNRERTAVCLVGLHQLCNFISIAGAKEGDCGSSSLWRRYNLPCMLQPCYTYYTEECYYEQLVKKKSSVDTENSILLLCLICIKRHNLLYLSLTNLLYKNYFVIYKSSFLWLHVTCYIGYHLLSVKLTYFNIE